MNLMKILFATSLVETILNFLKELFTFSGNKAHLSKSDEFGNGILFCLAGIFILWILMKIDTEKLPSLLGTLHTTIFIWLLLVTFLRFALFIYQPIAVIYASGVALLIVLAIIAGIIYLLYSIFFK
jgi:hypothetical protein